MNRLEFMEYLRTQPGFIVEPSWLQLLKARLFGGRCYGFQFSGYQYKDVNYITEVRNQAGDIVIGVSLRK